MNKFILTTILICGAGLECRAEQQFFTGDKAHGLMEMIRNSPDKKSTNRTYFIEDAKCESAVISAILNQPNGVPLQGTQFEVVGCTTDSTVSDIAMKTFLSTPAYASLLAIGFISNPSVASSTQFTASKVECIDNSDRCTITVSDDQ